MINIFMTDSNESNRIYAESNSEPNVVEIIFSSDRTNNDDEIISNQSVQKLYVDNVQKYQLEVAFPAGLKAALSNKWTVPAMICVGVKKGGTTALNVLLNQNIHEVWASIGGMTEFHYFDRECLPEIRLPHLEYFKSFNISLTYYNKYCSTEDYKTRLLKHFYHRNWRLEYNSNATHIFEKTPEYIMYPHIAYIIMNDFAKYGTKIIVLLRDPINRFISDTFHSNMCHVREEIRNECIPFLNIMMFFYGYDTKLNLTEVLQRSKTMDDVRNNTNKEFQIQIFNEHIGEQLELLDHDGNDEDVIYQYIADLYSDLFYIFHNSKRRKNRLLLWTRGCYAPQILHYILYAEQLGLRHSFKVIQSEQLFTSNIFEKANIISWIRCYMHSSDDEVKIGYDFDQWMEFCMTTKSKYYIRRTSEIGKKHRNKKAKEYDQPPLELQLMRNSYINCNRLLQKMLMGKFGYTVLGRWNLNMWNQQ